MVHPFSEENISAIESVLGVQSRKSGDVHRFEIADVASDRKIALEIHFDLQAKGRTTHLVSVYTREVFLQLHDCTAFIASEMLNQVTFFGRNGKQITGLIVEKQAGCSMYGNVEESLLKGDFTKLPPEIMMSSVALSLTESVDFGDFNFDDEL